MRLIGRPLGWMRIWLQDCTQRVVICSQVTIKCWNCFHFHYIIIRFLFFYFLHLIQSQSKGFLCVKDVEHTKKECCQENACFSCSQGICDNFFSSRVKFAHTTIFPFLFFPELFPLMLNILSDLYISFCLCMSSYGKCTYDEKWNRPSRK